MKTPHKSQSAAMDRAGELPDEEQLRECINSGQVSAAQVVAHAEAGELPEPFGFLLPMERSPAFHYMRRDDEKGIGVFTADQMRAYVTAAIAAKQEEVARLREALTRSMTALDDWTALYAPDMCSEEHVQAAHDRINEIGTLGYIADIQEKNAAALGQNQEENEHD